MPGAPNSLPEAQPPGWRDAIQDLVLAARESGGVSVLVSSWYEHRGWPGVRVDQEQHEPFEPSDLLGALRSAGFRARILRWRVRVVRQGRYRGEDLVVHVVETLGRPGGRGRRRR